MKKTFLFIFILVLSTLTLNAKDVNGQKPIVDKAQHDLYLQKFPPQHQVTYTSNNFAEVNIFEDNFDGDNSITALEARGWTVIDADGGGITAAWYQGTTAVFNAYAGPDTGYVAANYNGGNSSGVIDQWLISPEITVTAGDLLNFYHQSPVSSWDDSINVYVSPTGGATIPDFTVEWGRYVTSQGAWALWSEAFPASGTVRFAIRYYISDNVANSNFIGIDELSVFTPAGVLEPPTNLLASTGLVGMIELGWNAPAPSTNTLEQYYIYRDGSLYDSSATTMYVDNTVTPETDYSYTVSAMYTEGESVQSDPAVGSALDPASVFISEDFEGGVLPANWTIVDANSDAVTWEVYNGYNNTPGGAYSLSVSYNSAAPKDDWAFYGPMTLDDMTNYNLKFGYRIASATWPENLAVKLTSDAAGTTVATLWDQVGLTNVDYEMADLTFSPPSSGDFYIAFHATSPADQWRIAVDDILMTVADPMARLQVIHNAADVAADPVVVYLNGDTLLSSFAFREATPFIDAPAGVPLDIGIGLPGGTVNDTLKNFTVTLADGETYIAFANGVTAPGSYAANPDGRSTEFGLFINAVARETGTSSDVDFFVLHGATDAPTVDVIARGVATLVDDAAYGDITPYITVPPAAYTLDLTLADGTTLVESYIADLSTLGGGSAAVFASGFLTPSANQNGEAFGIFFALADGTVGEFPAGVVPVELTSFAASVSDAGVTLNWATATEKNNSGFSIERSVDNVEFNAIAFVDGMGTTTEITNYTYVDKAVNAAKAYYRLKQIDFDGTSSYSNVVEVDLNVPTDFSISQNYPNPFNPSTTIKFGLPVESKVTINLFNALGERVAQIANTDFAAGNQSIDFNASNLSSGVYFYTIEAIGVDGTNFVSSKKMMLMK